MISLHFPLLNGNGVLNVVGTVNFVVANVNGVVNVVAVVEVVVLRGCCYGVLLL